jgi:hypothetical protein
MKDPAPKKQRTYLQGLYKPQHPEKYIGDVNKITYRSSWELKFNKFLDNNPNITYWGSEVIAIPYIKCTDQKVHNYFPDYFIVFKDKNGQEHKELIEIKPASQTKLTKRSNLYEQITYAINVAKWESAKRWCDHNGVVFRILTEKELFTN